jgi:hypothetical protein
MFSPASSRPATLMLFYLHGGDGLAFQNTFPATSAVHLLELPSRRSILTM